MISLNTIHLLILIEHASTQECARVWRTLNQLNDLKIMLAIYAGFEADILK
jgi:hypothetical protein